MFKRFKSLAQLGHLPKYDDDSAKAWLYGKLLVALLVADSPCQRDRDLASAATTERGREFKFVLNQLTGPNRRCRWRG